MTEGPVIHEEYAYGTSFFELDAFDSDEYEPCYPEPGPSTLPSTTTTTTQPTTEPTPTFSRAPTPDAFVAPPACAPTRGASVTRRQRVSKSSTPVARAKKLEVMPLLCEEDEPTSSAWSTDEDERVAPPAPGMFAAALKKIRRHRPRPLGFVAARGSVAVVTEVVHAPGTDSPTGEVVFAFPHPPAIVAVAVDADGEQHTPSPATPTTPDVPARPTASPTPSVSSASSASPPRTPSTSDDDDDDETSGPRACDKPLPPRPLKIRHSDGVVENEPDELWDRRINEIFELLTSALDEPLADADTDDAPLHSLPVSPTSPTPLRRRGSYAHLIPKRAPPPPPMSPFPAPSPSPTPSSEGHPASTSALRVPRMRPTPPRSPVPTDIPVDVDADDVASSHRVSSVLDAYFPDTPVYMRSRFSASTAGQSHGRSRSRSGSTASCSSSGHSAGSRTSSSKSTFREGLRRKNIPVELFMRASP